jgi:hypothetical protein
LLFVVGKEFGRLGVGGNILQFLRELVLFFGFLKNVQMEEKLDKEKKS